MKQFLLAPEGFDYRQYLDTAHKQISYYTAIMIFDDGLCGSGIFVRAYGYAGILTAHHVARLIHRCSSFNLVVQSHKHEMTIESSSVQHIVIGDSTGNPQPEHGPDLSFVCISDVNTLAILDSIKSFYFLENKDLSFFDGDFAKMVWALSGSPKESWTAMGFAHDGQPITKVSNLVLTAAAKSYEERNGFDYLKFSLHTAVDNYPDEFGGMSGGGMWLTPLEITGEDLKSVAPAAPILAGVTFYQSEPLNGRRIITGHGQRSIYGRTMDVLRALPKK
jgi:hypothetical protein